MKVNCARKAQYSPGISMHGAFSIEKPRLLTGGNKQLMKEISGASIRLGHFAHMRKELIAIFWWLAYYINYH